MALSDNLWQSHNTGHVITSQFEASPRDKIDSVQEGEFTIVTHLSNAVICTKNIILTNPFCTELANCSFYLIKPNLPAFHESVLWYQNLLTGPRAGHAYMAGWKRYPFFGFHQKLLAINGRKFANMYPKPWLRRPDGVRGRMKWLFSKSLPMVCWVNERSEHNSGRQFHSRRVADEFISRHLYTLAHFGSEWTENIPPSPGLHTTSFAMLVTHRVKLPDIRLFSHSLVYALLC